MNALSVNLDGRTVEIQRAKIPLIKLVLDVENPRIQYYLDTRLNDDITQEKIKFALAEGNDQYDKLKEHIERNGGIYDPIWVVPEGEFFRVIEGNTRSFVYEELKFSYFVEFRKNKELKRLVNEGKLSLLDFCDWVGEGKFGRGEDIRKFLH